MENSPFSKYLVDDIVVCSKRNIKNVSFLTNGKKANTEVLKINIYLIQIIFIHKYSLHIKQINH